MIPCEIPINGYMIDCSTVINAILTIASLVLSVVAIIFTHRSLEIQREHNQKSVKPIARIHSSFTKNKFSILIINSGTGPMILKPPKIIIQNREYDYFHEAFPDLLRHKGGFKFNSITLSTTLNQGGEIELFAINYKENEKKLIELIRHLLDSTSINTEYKDIYDNEFSQIDHLSINNSAPSNYHGPSGA